MEGDNFGFYTKERTAGDEYAVYMISSEETKVDKVADSFRILLRMSFSERDWLSWEFSVIWGK